LALLLGGGPVAADDLLLSAHRRVDPRLRRFSRLKTWWKTKVTISL
jgi:hypothetical protein